MRLKSATLRPAAFAAVIVLGGLVPQRAAAQTGTSGRWQRSNLLGDLAGLRPALADRGITLWLQTSNEAFANTTGGINRGLAADGMTMLTLTMDTAKAIGVDGGTFNISGLWLYGPNFSQGYLGNLQSVSGIAGQPSVRLWEAWYQQFFLTGKLDIKLGQQSADQDFMVSTGASLFLNAMMG